MSLFDVVRDLCTGGDWWPSWVLALIRQLPDGSAFMASAAGGPEYRGWAPLEYLVALVVDAVQVNTTVTARAAGAKKAPTPDPVPRPGAKGRKSARGVPITALIARQGAVTPEAG